MKKLTRKQSEALRIIQAYIKTRGYSPSEIDLADLIGSISRTGARNYIKALQKKGYIRYDPGIVRSIVVIKDD